MASLRLVHTGCCSRTHCPLPLPQPFKWLDVGQDYALQLQQGVEKRLDLIVEFFSNKMLRARDCKVPFCKSASYPAYWHETHDPPVKFLIENKD